MAADVGAGTEREATVHEKLNIIEDHARALRNFSTNLRTDVAGPTPEPPTPVSKVERADSIQSQLDRITSLLRDAIAIGQRAGSSLGSMLIDKPNANSAASGY